MKVESESGISRQHGSEVTALARDPNEHRRSQWWIFLLALVIAVLLVVFGILPRIQARTALRQETLRMAVPTVAVVQPKRSAPAQEIVLPANVQAFADAPIYARTNGYLKRWYVDIGSRVKEGQLLAEIDTPEVTQQLRQARADLGTAQANLQANVQSAQANVKRLEELQSFQRIYAPFSGVITARNTDVGALINSGSSSGNGNELFHITQPDKLRVYVSVPQIYSQAAKAGITADLTLAEFPGRRFQGKLVRTANAIDPTSRTLLVEIAVDNPTGQLFTGSYAEVHFKLPTPTTSLILPVNTLLFRSEGLRVATVGQGQKVELKQITIGHDFGSEVEVVAGLNGNENVIVNPPDSVVEGEAVRIAQTQQGAQ